MILVTPSQMKSLEAIADGSGVSYEKLMLNAGQRLSESVYKTATLAELRSVVLLCGNGNNAGDCFVASVNLANLYALDVTVAMLCGDPKTELSKKTFRAVTEHPHIKVLTDMESIKGAVAKCEILVDGIFGTGFHGDLPESIQEVLATPNHAYIVAVDVPSGVNCNTGEVSRTTLKADETLTFAYPKLGMMLQPAREYCGKVVVADIGITQEHYRKVVDNRIHLLAKDVVALPIRSDFGNKGTFGRVLHVTGSKSMLGACIMASRSALRCGVGLVTVSTEDHALLPLTMPEPIYIGRDFPTLDTAIHRANAILVGCGLGTDANAVETFNHVVHTAERPLVIDADGINLLAQRIDMVKGKDVVLTPHPLEMSRLTNLPVPEIQSNRMEVAVNFAREHGCVVVLKGANTIVTDGNTTYVDATANSGMAKGGSGDVLAGMVSSYIAQGLGTLEASALAVYLHSQCGVACSERLSKYSALPTDTIEEIPNAIKRLAKDTT